MTEQDPDTTPTIPVPRMTVEESRAETEEMAAEREARLASAELDKHVYS
jgi:hypothetical protein